ncbi:MAG TPA: fumarylacetoacetate hydrolase family protein [Afifellaceae bacterium]|nr:fumarylacetoacetate hydrolase family protein [Afifellaceae bacterium]
MKLVRFGDKGSEKPGILDDDGAIRDASGEVDDYRPETIGPELLDRLRRLDPAALPRVDAGVRLGAPIARTGHFIAIGLNYEDHAREAGMAIPNEPIIFSKAPSSLNGPNDDVILPPNSEKGDWELELGIVIGRRASYVDKGESLDHVFGYCIANDVSERALQLEGTGQWIKGKSCETFGPLGPWLVTPDEIPDPQNLDMWLDVDGERMQTGNTRTMIFPCAELVAFCSKVMVLEPGDVIITGTPPGVGLGRKPPRFLKPGETMHLWIDGLGEQRQKVVRHRG